MIEFLSTPSARRATSPTHRALPGKVEFLSTPSARRATVGNDAQAQDIEISIHALREEGDFNGFARPRESAYFYPRPPRGGRRGRNLERGFGHSISIHALREEGDGGKVIECSPAFKFLSTPSARRATVEAECQIEGENDFYPRPPRGGRPW